MGNTVEVTIPVDADAAEALKSSARDLLEEVIGEAKREAHARGLTNGDIDAELEVWRVEHRT
jgi:hypothetical protein